MHGLRGGLAGAAGQAGNGAVDNIGAGLGGLQQGHGTHAGGAVGVDNDGQLDVLLEGRHQIIGLLGAHDAGHVLDADGVAAHGFQLLTQLHKHLQTVDGAGGIAQGTGNMSAGLDGLVYRHFNIPQVVEGIKDTDDVDAALHALADEGTNNIIGIMLIAQQVLAAEQHLQLGVLHMLADGAQALPGILVQIAQTAVKGGAAPALQRIIAGLIHFFQNGQEVLDGHTGGHQRLLTVSQYRLGDLNFHIGYLTFYEITIFPTV